jgi:hypothetical protein
MTGNTQQAFIAAHDFFTGAALPFGTGVIAETTEWAAYEQSIRQPALLTKNQWYQILIPAPEQFLRLHTPLQEQPFPVLHRLLSQKSLTALFYDEYARFKRRPPASLSGRGEADKPFAGDSETYAFFHKKRELLLSLPSGDSFLSLFVRDGADGTRGIIASFFDFLGIAGIQFSDSGRTRFLISNARKSVTITAIRRGNIIPRQGENNG